MLLLLLGCLPPFEFPEGLDRLCEPMDLTIPAADFITIAPSITTDNPDSGAPLVVSVVAPEVPIGWTVVLVPPGTAAATTLHAEARRLARAGAVVVVFDPDGRGASEGEEDYGGATHQAGLAQVITLAGELPCTERLGVMSMSMGVIMATGALAGDPDLPVSFLVDWEGPSDRHNTGCEGNSLGLPGCEDEAFWSQREASVSVAGLSMPYHRLQTLTDHVQPDAAHARMMLSAALAGGVPGVYLNTVELTESPASLVPLLVGWRDPLLHLEVLLDWADGL
ncbi:MAG: hypothetical protein ACI8RZ_003586 [Myxococcota bacterium]